MITPEIFHSESFLEVAPIKQLIQMKHPGQMAAYGFHLSRDRHFASGFIKYLEAIPQG